MYLSYLSLQKQVGLLIILILMLLLIVVLYAVIGSISKPLSTEVVTLNKTPKYKRVKLLSKKIAQKLIQIVNNNYKKIVRYIINIKNHNKQNDIQKK